MSIPVNPKNVLFVPAEEKLSRPETMKIVLLDSAARAHSAELAQLTDIECLTFNDELSAENLNVDLLFIVGDFDQAETQQAVQNLPKSANTFQMAIQLGKENGLWADSAVLLNKDQTVFDVINMLTQLIRFSDEKTFNVDFADVQQVCKGLRCKLISADECDREKMQNATQQLIAQLPENLAGIACLIRSDDSLELMKFVTLMDNLDDATNEDTMRIVGTDFDQAMNGKVSLTALVSFT